MFNRIALAAQQEQEYEEARKAAYPRMTLTVDELANELHISRPTAYELVKDQGFPSFMIGHRILVNRAGLQRWMDEKCLDKAA